MEHKRAGDARRACALAQKADGMLRPVLCAVAAAVFAIVCMGASGVETAYAASGDSGEAPESIRFENDEATVLSEALLGLDKLVEAGKEYRQRDEARYIQEAYADHQARAWRWWAVQAWRDRFPAGDYSDVLFIGDSLMDESRWRMMEEMPGCTVNADSGRTLEEGGLIREDADPKYGVLDHIRSDDGLHERYVIGTGNNDAGGMPLSAAEEIIARLGPDKEIYFITEIVTGNQWGTANTNETIDIVVEAYPNVHKIDWHGFVEGREGELLRDGCHPNEYGKPLYVQVLKAGLDVCYA